MNVQTALGRKLTLLQPFAGGGEAKIWTVRERAEWVAKIYHQPTRESEQKLKAMLANRPAQPRTHIAIAWPEELLYDGGRFIGFLMPNVQGNLPLVNLYNPLRRKQILPGFTWRYLHNTALNLAIAVDAIHACGHVIGDVNESNILANGQTLVTLVDTDSFQIQADQSTRYRCLVGKPEYTPPELQGVNFHTRDRQVEHDRFGVAILFFHLLMEGFHPFTGILREEQAAVNRTDLYCLQQGIFPYDHTHLAKPPPVAPPFAMLHPALQQLFLACFVDGHRDPARRPTMQAWRQALIQADRELIDCRANANHVYSRHLLACPWCAREGIQQRPLPLATAVAAPSPVPLQPATKPKAKTPSPKKRHQWWTTWQRRLRTVSAPFRRSAKLTRTPSQSSARFSVKLPALQTVRRAVLIRWRTWHWNWRTLARRPYTQPLALIISFTVLKLGTQFALPGGDTTFAEIALLGLAILPTVLGALIGGPWVGMAIGAFSALLDFVPGTDWRILLSLLLPATAAGLATPHLYAAARKTGVWQALLISGAGGALCFWLGMSIIAAFLYAGYPWLAVVPKLLLRCGAVALSTLVVMFTWRRIAALLPVRW